MLRICVCSESIIRFTKNSSEVFPKENDLVVIKKGWSSVRYNLKEVKGGLELQTDSLKVLLVYSPLRLVVMNKQGVVLYEEKDYTLNANADTCTAPRNVCTLFPEDHFFGFGERMDFLDQRGKRLYLNCELGKGPKPAVGGKDILRANYCPVPFYMSTRGYAIFWIQPIRQNGIWGGATDTSLLMEPMEGKGLTIISFMARICIPC